jgi:hypothetical protein
LLFSFNHEHCEVLFLLFLLLSSEGLVEVVAPEELVDAVVDLLHLLLILPLVLRKGREQTVRPV